jgi:hypothetical protein
MTGGVLSVRGLRVSYGGQSAKRSALLCLYSAPLSPALPFRGGSAYPGSHDV